MFGKADLERRLKVLTDTLKTLTSRLELAEDDQRHNVHMRAVHLQRIEALEKATKTVHDTNDRCRNSAMRQMHGIESRLSMLEHDARHKKPSPCPEPADICAAKLKAAADKNPFKPGDRVGYVGVKGCTPKWYGIVCPRPALKPQASRITGERFIYVVADNGDVYGCYAARLVRA